MLNLIEDLNRNGRRHLNAQKEVFQKQPVKRILHVGVRYDERDTYGKPSSMESRQVYILMEPSHGILSYFGQFTRNIEKHQRDNNKP